MNRKRFDPDETPNYDPPTLARRIYQGWEEPRRALKEVEWIDPRYKWKLQCDLKSKIGYKHRYVFKGKLKPGGAIIIGQWIRLVHKTIDPATKLDSASAKSAKCHPPTEVIQTNPTPVFSLPLKENPVLSMQC